MRKDLTGFYLAVVAIVLCGIFVLLVFDQETEPVAPEMVITVEPFIDSATVCLRILDVQALNVQPGHTIDYRGNLWFIDGMLVGSAPTEDSATILCGDREVIDLIDPRK